MQYVQRDWGLRHFIIPTLVGVVWIFTVVGVAGYLINQFVVEWQHGRLVLFDVAGHVLILWKPLLFLIASRVGLECLSVIFSIHDRLEDILEREPKGDL